MDQNLGTAHELTARLFPDFNEEMGLASPGLNRRALYRPEVTFRDRSNPDPVVVKEIYKLLSSDREVKELLKLRGFKKKPTQLQSKLLASYGLSGEKEELVQFLDTRKESLPRATHPERGCIGALELQVEVIKTVLRGGVIYEFNDYDVDGITSGSSFVLSVRSFGDRITRLKEEARDGNEVIDLLIAELPYAYGALLQAGDQVQHDLAKVPFEKIGDYTLVHRTAQRFAHGFGLNQDAVDEAVELGADLMLVSDCGNPKKEFRDQLHANGTTLAVVDHHMLGDDIPDDFILINPRQPGCNFGGGVLSTVGIISLIMRDLVTGSVEDEVLAQAGIGGHCDVMPSEGINRVLTFHATKFLKENPPPWAEVLFEPYRSDTKNPITTDDIGFLLGPHLNAIGRMSDPGSLGVDLLTARNVEEARELAEPIFTTNVDRKGLEQKLLRVALQAFNFEKPAIVGSFHSFDEFQDTPAKGVVGIVAGLLMRKFNKVALTFAADKERVITSSGRAPDDYHLTKLLKRAFGLYISIGGHEAAAGCKMREEHLSEFREALNKEVERLGERDGSITIDHRVTVGLDEVNFRKYKELHELIHPWGPQLPQPQVLVEGVLVDEITDNGYNLVVRLRQGYETLDNGKERPLIRYARWFKEAPFHEAFENHPLKEGAFVDVVGTMHVERHRGSLVTRLYLDEVRPSSVSTKWYEAESEKLAEQGQEMHRELLPSQVVFVTPDKETDPSETLGKRRVRKLGDFKQRKDKQTPTSKKLKKREEERLAAQALLEEDDEAQEEILIPEAHTTEDQITEDLDSLSSSEEELTQQEFSEEEEFQRFPEFAAFAPEDEEELEAESEKGDVEKPESLDGEIVLTERFLFDLEEDQSEKIEDKNGSLEGDSPVEENAEEIAGENVANQAKDFTRISEADPWEIVTLHDHGSVIIPESVKGFYKRYPAVFVNRAEIGYRVPQMQALTFIRESESLIEAERKAGVISEEHLHWPQFVIQSDMNTGKTGMSFQAVARVLENQPSNGKREPVVFMALDESVRQIRSQALRYLHLKEEQIGIFTGTMSEKARAEELKRKPPLWIVTPGSFSNFLKRDRARAQQGLPSQFAPERFGALVIDECHNLIGDTYHVHGLSAVQEWIDERTLVIAMSGTIEDIDLMRDKYFPRGLTFKAKSEAKRVEIRDEVAHQADETVEDFDIFERKMIPLVDEIAALTEPLQVLEEEVELLKKIMPRRARAQRRVQNHDSGKQKLEFDWSTRFRKIARFTRDGTLSIRSFGELSAYTADFQLALKFHKQNPRIHPKAVERMDETMKWLLTLQELTMLSQTLVRDERMAFLEYSMPKYTRYLAHQDSSSENKAIKKLAHFEKLVYEDPEVQGVLQRQASALFYGRPFENSFSDLTTEVFDRAGQSDAEESDILPFFQEIAREDLFQKIISGEQSNGPKTDKLPKLISDRLSVSRRSKAVVFVDLVNNNHFLTRYLNALDLGYTCISRIGKGSLLAEQQRFQDSEMERFRTGRDECRVLVGTDAVKTGMDVPEVNELFFFNLEVRKALFHQALARARGERPLAFFIPSLPCGSDEAYAGIGRRMYNQRRQELSAYGDED